MLTSIWRYPLKSAQGERLEQVYVGSDGPEGDRSWACVADDGMLASAKNPPRWGRLLEVTIERDKAGGDVWIRIPGQEPLLAGSGEADVALSAFLGERVRLVNEVPPGARLGRIHPTEPGMIPDWDGSAPGAPAERAYASTRSDGRFVDFGAVHIVTTAELARLEAEGVEADARRFRPNLVLSRDAPLDPGTVLQVGAELRLRVLTPTARCALPGAAQPGLPRSPELLRALGRHRLELPGRGRAASLGCYAEILTEGTVRVGDPISVGA